MIFVYIAECNNVYFRNSGKPLHVVVAHAIDTNMGNAQFIAWRYSSCKGRQQNKAHSSSAAISDELAAADGFCHKRKIYGVRKEYILKVLFLPLQKLVAFFI